MAEPSLRDAAYHEAGHAVVGLLAGGHVNYIINRPRDHCASLCEFPGLAEKVSSLLAGSLAEHIGKGGVAMPSWFNDEPSNWRGASDDCQMITDAFDASPTYLSAEAKTTIIRVAKESAWEILTSNVNSLIALAAHIAVNERTEGAEAVEIVRASRGLCCTLAPNSSSAGDYSCRPERGRQDHHRDSLCTSARSVCQR